MSLSISQLSIKRRVCMSFLLSNIVFYTSLLWGLRITQKYHAGKDITIIEYILLAISVGGFSVSLPRIMAM